MLAPQERAVAAPRDVPLVREDLLRAFRVVVRVFVVVVVVRVRVRSRDEDAGRARSVVPREQIHQERLPVLLSFFFFFFFFSPGLLPRGASNLRGDDAERREVPKHRRRARRAETENHARLVRDVRARRADNTRRPRITRVGHVNRRVRHRLGSRRNQPRGGNFTLASAFRAATRLVVVVVVVVVVVARLRARARSRRLLLRVLLAARLERHGYVRRRFSSALGDGDERREEHVRRRRKRFFPQRAPHFRLVRTLSCELRAQRLHRGPQRAQLAAQTVQERGVRFDAALQRGFLRLQRCFFTHERLASSQLVRQALERQGVRVERAQRRSVFFERSVRVNRVRLVFFHLREEGLDVAQTDVLVGELRDKLGARPDLLAHVPLLVLHVLQQEPLLVQLAPRRARRLAGPLHGLQRGAVRGAQVQEKQAGLGVQRLDAIARVAPGCAFRATARGRASGRREGHHHRAQTLDRGLEGLQPGGGGRRGGHGGAGRPSRANRNLDARAPGSDGRGERNPDARPFGPVSKSPTSTERSPVERAARRRLLTRTFI